MITLQYLNNGVWEFVSEWPNEASAWAALGVDNKNYRTIDQDGNVLTDKS